MKYSTVVLITFVLYMIAVYVACGVSHAKFDWMYFALLTSAAVAALAAIYLLIFVIDKE